MKKFTFNDWLDVKVVLKNNEIIPNENSKIKTVSLDEFELEDRNKIITEQRIIFKQLFRSKFDELMKDFHSKLTNTLKPIAYKDREVESLRALFRGKFICKEGICISPVKGDNKTFDEWYYKSMMRHYSRAISNGGIVNNYDELPSPNSNFYDNGMIPAEVMISVFSKMLSTLEILASKKDKRKKINDNKPLEKNSETIIENSKSADITDYSTKDSDTISDNEEWKKYFSEQIAYDFFLDCVEKLPNTGRDDTSVIVKYALIYHFFQNNKLMFEHINHNAFMKYLTKKHEVKFSDNVIAFPKSRSRKNDLAIQLLFQERFPSRKVK